MKDVKPIVALWCALALLLAAVVVVRAIHQRGELPLSAVKIISDTNGRVTAITVSNRPVRTFTYGDDANGPKVTDTNVVTYHYDASGERIVDANSPTRPAGK